MGVGAAVLLAGAVGVRGQSLPRTELTSVQLLTSPMHTAGEFIFESGWFGLAYSSAYVYVDADLNNIPETAYETAAAGPKVELMNVSDMTALIFNAAPLFAGGDPLPPYFRGEPLGVADQDRCAWRLDYVEATDPADADREPRLAASRQPYTTIMCGRATQEAADQWTLDVYLRMLWSIDGDSSGALEAEGVERNAHTAVNIYDFSSLTLSVRRRVPAPHRHPSHLTPIAGRLWRLRTPDGKRRLDHLDRRHHLDHNEPARRP